MKTTLRRYRLVDRDGCDLGPLVSKRVDWCVGSLIERGEARYRVLAVVDAEPQDDLTAYLVVTGPLEQQSAGSGPEAPTEMPPRRAG